MKPRTKLQFEVMECKSRLHNRENEMLSWAKVECLEHRGYATKTRVICMDCGNNFSPDLVKRKRAVCPHCDTKLRVEQSRIRTDKQSVNVATAEIYGEFQVIRNFEIFAYYKAGESARYFIWEVLQHWILPDGKREVVARGHNMGCAAWCGDMEIRQKTVGSYYSSRKNEVHPYKYHPKAEFKSQYRLYGIDHNLQGLTFLEAIKLLPDNPQAETLLKAKQYYLLSYCYNYQRQISYRWPSIKICMRNKYIVKDVRIWFDHLDSLDACRKDLRNSHYVCPKNLKRDHDRLVARRRRMQEKEKLEKQRERALQDEAKFQELKKHLFGVEFSEGNIHINVIDSVKGHMIEGDKLKHCVFTNAYYLKEDSLILSAKVKGKHTETVEISLKQLKVVQCRGLQNSNTQYHDRIIKIVTKNMHLIKERIKPKRTRPAQQSASHFNQVAV